MTSRVPIHARNHRRGGVDPLDLAPFLPRARVWGTHAIEPFTVSAAVLRPYPFNHGWTSDQAVFTVEWSFGEDPPYALIWIQQPGVYSITYRFFADGNTDAEGEWEGTFLTVGLYEPSPDYWDGFYEVLALNGTTVARTFVTTIMDDPGYIPQKLYTILGAPIDMPGITFGRTLYHDSFPHFNTGCYMEAARLGDADTDDWIEWNSSTGPDEALPDDPATTEVAPPRVRRGQWA